MRLCPIGTVYLRPVSSIPAVHCELRTWFILISEFSNFSMQQNQLQSLVKHRLLGFWFLIMSFWFSTSGMGPEFPGDAIAVTKFEIHILRPWARECFTCSIWKRGISLQAYVIYVVLNVSSWKGKREIFNQKLSCARCFHTSFNAHNNLTDRHRCPHFLVRRTEAERGQFICLSPWSS